MKKFFNSFIMLSLVFVCVVSTPTFGKYVSDSTGLAWVMNLSGFSIIGDIFIVEDDDIIDDGVNDPFWESDKLWGAANEEGKVEEPNSEYNMGNLEGVFYEVYNNTNNPVLIIFDLEYCAPASSNEYIGGGIIFYLSNITVDENGKKPMGTSDDFGTPVPGEIVAPGTTSQNAGVADVFSTRDSESSFREWFTNYYLHQAIIDPTVVIDYDFGEASFERTGLVSSTLEFTSTGKKITKEFIEENFVLQPGESANFNISTDYQGFLGGGNSINSCYATVKLRAIPYTG